MVILVTAAALVVIAAELAAAGDKEDAPGIFERVTMVAVIAAAIWLASTWILALLHQLTFLALATRAGVFAVIAIALAAKRLRQWKWRRVKLERPIVLLLVVLFLPILFWIEFMLWRGAIVPPLSHDALSYHLPKAVLFARADGFRYLTELDPRARNIPANYELLLSEFIVTQHSDRYTEWLSTLVYLLVIGACGALAERWWGRKLLPVLLTMMFAAGIPVLLLHSGAHKNDTLVAFFMIAAMVFAGRFLRSGGAAALLLLIASVAMALGTKPQAAGLALFLAPLVLVRFWREFSLRKIAAVVAFGIAAFLLLGGAVYVVNVLENRAVVAGAAKSEEVIVYGDWRNLWQGPYVLLAAPFIPSAYELPVPWESEPWFWRRDEIYFSHLGIPFAICFVLMPLAMLRWHRADGAYERWAITIAALAAFALMLPVVFRPHGMYAISLPRYALFLVPIVFGWTVAPLAAERERAAKALAGVSVLAFLSYATYTAFNDRFVPLDFVLWAREHPDTRFIPFDPGRAASTVDRLAGPNDKVAVDVSYSSWIQPVFGANLTRPVFFIPPGEGPPEIPADVKWVAIDRGFSIIWEAEGLTDLSQAHGMLQQGQPRAEDLRVRRALLKDRRFKLVYVRRGTNQLVFERVR
jgi:hypothetical protein